MFKHIFRAAFMMITLLFILLAALCILAIHFLPGMEADTTSLLLYLGLPALIIYGLITFLCGVASHVTAMRIAAPLNSISPDAPPKKAAFEEVEPLIRRMQEKQAAFGRKQEEFEKTTRYMTEGLILLSESGKVITLNDAARRIFRLDGQVEGRDILFLYPSDMLRQLLQSSREGRSSEIALRIRNISYQINASPIFQSGKVSGVVLLIFDITQREQAEKMRREFTANVSHELKTPLQTISGCAELLSSGMVKTEDVPRFSQQIHTEARRMITLVEDILKLSRLDEGEGSLEREEVDLFALVQKTMDVLAPAAQAAQVQLQLKGESCRMTGIPQLLDAIVYNLCDNAIKYNMPGGEVLVEIKKKGNATSLTVQDTGIGIPIHQQERVFERFYRVDKSHSKKVGGTGLGLSIVKHAARLHDARIRLESQVGKGTKVKILFPEDTKIEKSNTDFT